MLDFLRRLYEKAGEDHIFFLAGAIAFNVLIAIIPLFLFAVGISGFFLGRLSDPSAPVVDFLLQQIPAIGGDIALVDTVEEAVRGIVGQSRSLISVGSLLLIWFSTRLVGTLRTVLREVFDVAQERSVVRGKIFDIQVVVVGGMLFLVNLGVTTVVTTAQTFGTDLAGLQGRAVTALEQSVAFGLSFVSIWVLFVGIYRFLPARTIPWRTAIIAATFSAVLHDVLKWAFGWYVTELANYQTTYGNLVTLAILFLWIYYGAIVFILGGEVAQVWTMRRARRIETRAALFGEASSEPPVAEGRT